MRRIGRIAEIGRRDHLFHWLREVGLSAQEAGRTAGRKDAHHLRLHQPVASSLIGGLIRAAPVGHEGGYQPDALLLAPAVGSIPACFGKFSNPSIPSLGTIPIRREKVCHIETPHPCSSRGAGPGLSQKSPLLFGSAIPPIGPLRSISATRKRLRKRSVSSAADGNFYSRLPLKQSDRKNLRYLNRGNPEISNPVFCHSIRRIEAPANAESLRSDRRTHRSYR